MTLGGPAALALCASAFWGAADFTGGLATRRAAAYTVVAIAHGSSLLLVLLYAAAIHAALPSSHTLVYGLIGGAAGGLGLVLFYAALAMGEMGLTAAISGVLTAAVPVVFAFFTEAPPRPAQIAGFVLAALAIWLIASAPRGKAQPRGLALSAIAGCGFGTQLIFLKLADHGALWPLACSRIASAGIATSISVIALTRKKRAAPEMPRRSLPLVVGIAVLAGVFDSGGNACYTTAAIAGRLDVAAVLASLYPAVTILLAVWLLRERTRTSQAVGMALALTAVMLISL